MPLSADLLLPIPGGNPSGENLYSTPLFAEIRESRRQDDAGPQGEWQHEIKTADYAEVIKMTAGALQKQTKDLFLASWLTEALLNKQGFAGLRDGLELIHGLISNFWDTLYPVIEDGEAEFRASPLEWLGNYLEPSKGSSPALAVKMVPITANGIDWLRYSDSRKVPSEEEAGESDVKRETRAKLIKEGKLPVEEVDNAIKQTPKLFYVKLYQDIADALASTKRLDDLCTEKFGEFAPSFGRLKKETEEVATTVNILLKKKRELEPDPVAETVAGPPEGLSSEAETTTASTGPLSLGDIKNREDAVQHILAAVRFLRTSEPKNPAGYLVARALRWGNCAPVDPRPILNCWRRRRPMSGCRSSAPRSTASGRTY